MCLASKTNKSEDWRENEIQTSQTNKKRKRRAKRDKEKHAPDPRPARPSDEQFQITVRVMDGVIMMDDDDERMMVTEMVINTHTTAPCVPVQ